jgi:hypothetical protein
MSSGAPKPEMNAYLSHSARELIEMTPKAPNKMLNL